MILPQQAISTQTLLQEPSNFFFFLKIQGHYVHDELCFVCRVSGGSVPFVLAVLSDIIEPP